MKIETIVNQVPSLTWNWLKMNRGILNIETSLSNKLSPKISGITKDITISETDENNLFSNIEEGIKTDEFFTNATTTFISIEENVKQTEPVILNYKLESNFSGSARQLIYAKKNSEVTVIIVSSSDKDSSGFEALSTKLYTEENAKIHLVKVQLLGKDFIHIDSTSSFSKENSNIQLTQIFLGAKETFVGVKGNLSEYKSSFNSNTAYYCEKQQKLDLNYVVNHYGKKTECKMLVKGTLTDESQKTYRGTIDFKNGCTGAIGDEQEETLLLSPKVVNKSLPVILCDEEDVSGEHGASIGKLGEDVLFYMKSKGISKKVAEEIISRAKVQSVASLIPDENTIKDIQNFMDGVFSNE